MTYSVTYEIECLEEDTSPEGCFDSGSGEQDKEIVQKIIDDYNSGNPWAWCVVRVIAKAIIVDPINGEAHTFIGDDYLGQCSYPSEDDFKRDGYYEDMKKTAFSNLVETLDAATKRGELANTLYKGLMRDKHTNKTCKGYNYHVFTLGADKCSVCGLSRAKIDS